VPERERRPPNPPTRVGNVVIFANGEVKQLSLKQAAALAEGKELLLPTPPHRLWKEVAY
jgi:5-formyltetrahydrofolate cyclo-ligase